MRTNQLFRVISGFQQISRGFKTSYPAGLMAPIKVGDPIPNVDLYNSGPDDKVNAASEFGKGTHVIFAIFGAYTGTCKGQVPSFLDNYQKFVDKGVKSVNCVSVNDPFVMQAFSESMGMTGKVRCLADTHGKFTKALDLEVDGTAFVGNMRSNRYVMVVKDGKVSDIKVEDDFTKVTRTAGTDALAML